MIIRRKKSPKRSPPKQVIENPIEKVRNAHMQHLHGIIPSDEIEILKVNISNVRQNNLFYSDDLAKQVMS